MTAISTLFTNSCTVHASDSLLTVGKKDGTFEPKEFRKTKIVSIERYRGAMSYWGLATCGSFSTYDWLCSQRSKALTLSAEEYAAFITTGLNEVYRKLGLLTNSQAGLGIHFSCYEFIDNQWMPELFLITNYKNLNYEVDKSGFHYSRETYKTIHNAGLPLSQHIASDSHHRDSVYRQEVKSYVDSKGLMWFNNGDPLLFNPAANALFSAFMTLKNRGSLKQPFGPKECRDLARRPVEIVKNVQRDFCSDGKKIVGGKVHDLSITPRGVYESGTGDT